MPKTVEELTAELSDAMEKIDGLVNSKNTILDEKKKLEKKYKEFDSDEYFKLRDEHDALQNNYKKLELSVKTKDKDFEKLTNSNTELNGSLNKLLIDDAIAKTLNGLEKHKLNDGALELATMSIKSQKPTLVDGVAVIGDKPMSDYITSDWLENPSSRNLVTPNENSGGGAYGGNKSGGGSSIKTDGMSPTEMMKAGRAERNK